MQPLRAALDQAGVFQRFDIFVHALVVAAEGAGEGGDAGFGAGVELAYLAYGVERHKFRRSVFGDPLCPHPRRFSPLSARFAGVSPTRGEIGAANPPRSVAISARPSLLPV
jgi:hypothetical protein